MRRRRLELILDLTSRCNIRCVMCYFSTTDRLRFKPFELDPGSTGDIDIEVFRHLASELFPSARSVGLGCAAEPLLHPRFAEMLSLTRTYRVPDVWLQTNLLALSAASAQAIVDQRVRTVAVSIDGTTRATYERIRVGASWDRLLSRIELLRQAGASSPARPPRLRITFAWMRSNREELGRLPAFAQSIGAHEIDVRFVAPTVAVDNRDELLRGADRGALMNELWNAARDATTRGIRLSAYPAMDREPGAGGSPLARLRRKLWLVKSGIDGPTRWRRSLLEGIDGCSFPGRTLLIRPNGAVLPCPFWEAEPIALVPDDKRSAILDSEALGQIRRGLRNGCPVGSCRNCEARKDALFRPFIRAAERLVEPR